MEVGVLIALIASATSLVGTGASLWWQRRTAREAKEEERRSAAQAVLERYRGPLLNAASDLGSRIDNIRHKDFLAYTADAKRARRAKLTTLFRFADYLGWREVLRREAQLLRFEDEEETALVSELLNDVGWALATDAIDGTRAMLWTEEQRGIGELMTPPREDESKARTLGYATFEQSYDAEFQLWMEDFSEDLVRSAGGARLRLLTWALLGLVAQLDTEGIHRHYQWVAAAREEFLGTLPPGPGAPRIERRIAANVQTALERAGWMPPSESGGSPDR
jgi:hypothetical protein